MMKRILSVTLISLLATASAASAQTTVFSHSFDDATAGDLSDGGDVGNPAVGTLVATGGFISANGGYTSGNNLAFNGIVVDDAGSFNDVGTPDGNFVTINLSEPAAVTGTLGADETTTVDFSVASFGTNNPTIFKYVHIIGESSTGAEVFHIVWRAGSNSGARQVFARELGQDNTNYMVADPPVVRDGNTLDFDFESTDGTLLATGISFGINSTNTNSAPARVAVSITINESGWDASAAPSGGGSTQTPATGLGIASGATDLASIVVFSSHNSLNGGNVGFWLDNIVVATDQTVQGNPVLKGDVDTDGDVDFADIPSFIAVLQGGGSQAEADCDCSGQVDFSDIPAFITILQNQ